MRVFRVSALPAVLVAATFAVALAPGDEDPWKSQTFLDDYSLLKPVSTTAGREYVYFAAGTEERLAAFDAVMVDQPEIAVSPDSPYHSAKPADLEAISEFTRGAIVASLQARGYRIAEQAGPNVLYMRVALTDLHLKRKRRGVLSYTPIGAVVHGVKAAVQEVMKDVDILSMAGQAEISASDTGEVLGALVCLRTATAPPDAPARPERMTFEEFGARVQEYGERMACRLANARRPAERRIDCSGPAVRGS
ncbi:MAG TPA: DUF3313 family protein [Candidatus Polarisedimenticolaceae bacterium]